MNDNIIRTLKNPVQGAILTFSITEESFASLSMGTTNTIEIEVTDGSATTYRRYTFVKTNSAPLINYSGQSDLGQLTSKPTITYSVSDNEGDTITVTEKLNGEVIRQFTATSNTNYTITLTDEFWLTCGKNTNTIEISASDVNGGTSYKYITFTRQVNKVQITTKNPIETDVAATKIMVTGKSYLLYAYVDKTGRLAATTYVDSYIDIGEGYKVDDEVEVITYGKGGEKTIRVAIDGKYQAIILGNEHYKSIFPGDKLKVRVKKIYEDGVVGVTPRKKRLDAREEIKERIMLALAENDGMIPYNDKTSPEIIKENFFTSKNYFKMALGALMKEGKIYQDEEGTKLK